MSYKKQNNKIKHEDIIKYWENKIKITPEWNEALIKCWACGYHKPKQNLEKCHIIPEILGGEMSPSNMILLCPICHFQNPETIYEEDYWLWFKSRIKNNRTMIENDDFLKIGKEFKLIYDLDPYCGCEIFLNKDGGFIEKLLSFMDNNSDKFYLRKASTSAIAMFKYQEQEFLKILSPNSPEPQKLLKFSDIKIIKKIN